MVESERTEGLEMMERRERDFLFLYSCWLMSWKEGESGSVTLMERVMVLLQ